MRLTGHGARIAMLLGAAAVAGAVSTTAHASAAPRAASRTIHLTIALKSRNPRGLNAFARAVATPGSPEYRRYLSVGQFARRFGATPAALRISATAFRRAGLRVGAPAADGLSLAATGNTTRIDRALHTHLDAFASRAAPAIPAAAAPYVQDVSGLDDRDAGASPGRSADPRPARTARQATPRGIVTGGPQPCAAATTKATTLFAGSSGTLAYRSGYTADELAAVYGFSGLYGAGDKGAGQTVALDEETPYQPSDVQTFQQCYGTNASVTNVDVGGGVGTTVTLDTAATGIETITSLAPDANVLVYQGTDQVAIFSKMVSDDRAKVISSSWTSCEAAGSARAASYETLFEEAAVQGQSVFAASGDHGSTCTALAGSTPLGTVLPASAPTVTAVGGTTLYANASVGAEPFAAGRTPQESVWNNGVVSSSPTGSGGGLSSIFAMPSYQSGAAPALGVVGSDAGGSCGASKCREVPDVSADGDGGSGYTVYSQGMWKVLGGTNVATPVWAAFAALTNASPACRGASIGFVDPSLYQLAGGASAASLLNDIVNASPRTAAANNDAAGTNGGHYALRTGYDMATGLGSMHGAALAAALCQLRAPAYAVTIANPGAQTTTAGTAATLQLQGTDSGSLPLSYTASGLPPGLTMSGAGTVTGTPTTPGAYTVTVQADDVATNQAAIQFTWTITTPATPVPAKPAVHPGKPTAHKARVTGIATGHPKLSVTIDAGTDAPAIHAIALTVPSDLELARASRTLAKGITVTSAGKRDKVTVKRKGHQLRLTLSRAARAATVTIARPTITVGRSFRGRVRRHKVKTLHATLTATDTSSKATALHLTLKL